MIATSWLPKSRIWGAFISFQLSIEFCAMINNNGEYFILQEGSPRGHVLAEIVDTEKSYVESLRTLVNVSCFHQLCLTLPYC